MSDSQKSQDEVDERVLGSNRRRLRSAAVVLSMAFRADPIRATALFVLTLAQSFSVAGAAYALKLITDAIAQSDRGALIPAIGILAAVSAVTSLSNLTGFMLRLRVIESTQQLIDQHLIALTTGIPGLEHHERPEYLDQIERLRERRQQLAQSVGSIVTATGVLGQSFSTVGLLGAVHPILLTLPLFGLPSFVLEARAERKRRVAWEGTTERFRMSKHLFELATTAAPGKELRVFGVSGEIVERHRATRTAIADEMNRVGARTAWMSAGGWLFFALGYVAALAYVLGLAFDGRATAGDVVLVVSLGTQVNEQVGGLVGTLNWMMQSLDVVRRYLWLTDHANQNELKPVDRVEVPDRLADGIRLEGVTFRYPGTDVDVLTNVDLHLPAGSTVAVVGDNGAGKTTLMKLICRFYEPTEGRITVDGTDVRRFDVSEWRSRMAAGFQDFARFEFVAKETVGVGELAKLDNVESVTDALDRAHAADVRRSLPDDLETQLGKSFENGHELSGGQWQKLALGRAMMRDEPLVLVLDEPTASLDAETEHALFERYAGAARDVGARSGAITLLVSHRFSTVRMANLIVVVEGGRIEEAGSHSELMARQGVYAELYELQARAYR